MACDSSITPDNCCCDPSCPPLSEAGPRGGQGLPGTPGNEGTDGQSAFTTLTAGATQPASGDPVTVPVVNSEWMAIGEPLFVVGGGFYTVLSIPSDTSVELTNLGYPGNATPGDPIANGAAVVATGLRGATGAAGAVTLIMPTEFSVAGTGPITVTKVNQTANTVWAGPTTGVPAVPTFRTLVAADLPVHATRHAANGSDALDWGGTIHGTGTLAARPAAAAGNNGYLYFATDVVGGTLYRSNGATWSVVSASVNPIFSGTSGGVELVVDLTAGDPVFYTFGVDTISPFLSLFRANGTSAAPTAVLSGEGLGGVAARGYGATNYGSQGSGVVGFYASENHTDLAHGTGILFRTTPNGTASRIVAGLFDNDGSLHLKSGLTFDELGKVIAIAQGANAASGSATLVAGTVTVATTAIATGDHVILTAQDKSTSTAIGRLTKGTIVNATSFVINSLKADATVETNDVSVVHWMIVRPV